MCDIVGVTHRFCWFIPGFSKEVAIRRCTPADGPWGPHTTLVVLRKAPRRRGTITLFFLGMMAWILPAGRCDATPTSCSESPELAARIRAHPDAQAWIDLGNWFGEHNQLGCAQQAFHSGLQLEPGSAQLNYLLGLSLYGSGDAEGAVAPLRRSVEADSTVLKPHLLLATVYANLGQAAEAEKEWRAALQIDANSDVALHGLSQALLAQENYRAEIGLLRSAKLDPSLAVGLTVAYNALGMVDDAVSTLKAALNANPDSVPLSVTLVTLDISDNLYTQAEQQAEKCFRAHPDDVEAQVSYMKTLVLNGNWTAAGSVGQELLSDAPHRYETLYLNGVLERQNGDFAAARDHLTEAESLKPNVANLHYNLGVALTRLHDLDGGIKELRKAIAQGDSQPETHFELANALRLEKRPKRLARRCCSLRSGPRRKPRSAWPQRGRQKPIRLWAREICSTQLRSTAKRSMRRRTAL